jgi:hypothetical protein
MEQDEFQDTADVILQHQNKPLAPRMKYLEVPRVTDHRDEKMAADRNGNLGIRIPKEDVSRN